MKIIKREGFTLIEVLLVIAILAILAAIVIIAINPAKQFGEAQNADRRSDVSSILNAVQQYAIDNHGSYPSDIPWGEECLIDGTDICRSEMSCDGVSLDDLITDEKYLTEIPTDPTVSSYELTGYKIFMNTAGRIGVCAPGAYGDYQITIVQ